MNRERLEEIEALHTKWFQEVKAGGDEAAPDQGTIAAGRQALAELVAAVRERDEQIDLLERVEFAARATFLDKAEIPEDAAPVVSLLFVTKYLRELQAALAAVKETE